MEDIFAKLGIKLSHLIIGFLAGGVGLVFNKKPSSKRAKIKIYVIIVSGAILTGFVTPVILLWQTWLTGAEHGVAFLIGIFGMGVIEATLSFLKVFRENPMESINKMKDYKR